MTVPLEDFHYEEDDCPCYIVYSATSGWRESEFFSDSACLAHYEADPGADDTMSEYNRRQVEMLERGDRKLYQWILATYGLEKLVEIS
jgi:hypothetical protein